LADPHDKPSASTRRLALVPLVLIVAVLAAGTLAPAGGDSGQERLPGGVKRAQSETFSGTTTTPIRSAPAIALRSHRGRPVTLEQYRGRPVLVTFLYSHCPDVCGLIMANLKRVRKQLGARARTLQIIGVSVDPRGDTPQRVADYLDTFEMADGMQYLLGAADRLARTWKAWNVGSERDASRPELVAHSALVYGISASGRLVTLYPPDFQPADIVHDVPLLAAR
jgi:protein SCO1